MTKKKKRATQIEGSLPWSKYGKEGFAKNVDKLFVHLFCLFQKAFVAAYWNIILG